MKHSGLAFLLNWNRKRTLPITMILLSSFSKNDLKYLCLVEWPALETYSLLYSELDKITFLLFKNVHVTNWQSPPPYVVLFLTIAMMPYCSFYSVKSLLREFITYTHTHQNKQTNKQKKHRNGLPSVWFWVVTTSVTAFYRCNIQIST